MRAGEGKKEQIFGRFGGGRSGGGRSCGAHTTNTHTQQTHTHTHTTHQHTNTHTNTHTHRCRLLSRIPSLILSRCRFFVPFVAFYFVPNVCFFVPLVLFVSRQLFAYFVPFAFFCPATAAAPLHFLPQIVSFLLAFCNSGLQPVELR